MWHDPEITDAERQALTLKGGLASVKTLPPDTADPVFRSIGALVRFHETQAGMVLRGELAPSLAAEARQHAMAAAMVLGLDTEARLARIERAVREREKAIARGGVRVLGQATPERLA